MLEKRIEALEKLTKNVLIYIDSVDEAEKARKVSDQIMYIEAVEKDIIKESSPTGSILTGLKSRIQKLKNDCNAKSHKTGMLSSLLSRFSSISTKHESATRSKRESPPSTPQVKDEKLKEQTVAEHIAAATNALKQNNIEKTEEALYHLILALDKIATLPMDSVYDSPGTQQFQWLLESWQLYPTERSLSELANKAVIMGYLKLYIISLEKNPGPLVDAILSTIVRIQDSFRDVTKESDKSGENMRVVQQKTKEVQAQVADLLTKRKRPYGEKMAKELRESKYQEPGHNYYWHIFMDDFASHEQAPGMSLKS